MKSNVVGTIFYNYDSIESSCDVKSDLFNIKIGFGSESIVYEGNEEYVYKISKLGFTNEEEFDKYLKDIQQRNECPIMEPQIYVGTLKHLIADVYHPVFKQKRVKIFKDIEYNTFIINYINNFIKSGWIPNISQYSKENQVIYDINPRNCGLDKDGNLKIIDCMIYTK